MLSPGESGFLVMIDIGFNNTRLMEYLFGKVTMIGIVTVFNKQEQRRGSIESGKALSLPLNDQMKLK